MRTMKNMVVSNTGFINWMFSISKSKRFTMINSIGQFLAFKGLSSGKIARALRQLHTYPSVVVKRLSSKEITTCKRKKKKSIIKSKRNKTTTKTECIDSSVKEDNDFCPIITSVRSLQNDEGFVVTQSKNISNPTLIIEKQNKLPVDEIKENAENAIIDNPSISSSENNQQLVDENIASIGKSEGKDLPEVNEFANKSRDGGDEVRQTEDLCKHMPGTESVENKDIILDNVFSNKSIKLNKALPKSDNVRLQNNTKNDSPSKNQITKLQDKLKLDLISKQLRGLERGKAKEEKKILNVRNDLSSVEVRKSKEDSNSPNSSSVGEVVQLKETSNNLETHNKPINNNGNENETNKTVNTELILSLNTEKTKSQSNVQDQLSISTKQRPMTEKTVQNEESEEPLNKESLLTDQVRVNKSHKHKNIEVTKTNYKGTDQKKSLKSNKNSEQKEVIKGLVSQAKYLEECLIARKRSAKFDLEIPKTKMKKISTEKLIEKTVTSDGTQNLNGESQTKPKEPSRDIRKICDNLEKVLASSSKQQNVTQTHTITTLDKRQPNDILSNDESLEVEVLDRPKIVDSLVQNNCNSEGKVDKDSEHAISDCTVSSSSMIETPLETCFSHDVESVVDTGIPEIVSLSHFNEKEGVYSDAIENFSVVGNKQYLLSSKVKMIDKEYLLLGEEKLINDSVNLYLNYFEKSDNPFTSVPIKIQEAIKNCITSKGNNVKTITVNAVIKEYLTSYTTHFDVINNKVVYKTAEVLHLAIADSNRREERTKLALRLDSDVLRDEEINRANCDYEEILKVRGAEFSEMFQSMLNKFEKCVCLVMTVTLFFKIIQALLHIDSDNIKYFNLMKNLMWKLLTTNNQECPCYSFVNLSDLELESNYQFVQNCLVTYYLTRYRQDKSDTESKLGFRFALLGPTSNELKIMVSELIIRYKTDLDHLFVLPSSCTDESANKMTGFDSTQHTQSLTQFDKSDQNTDTSRGNSLTQTVQHPKDSNINSIQKTQIYQEDNEVPKSLEKQTLQNLQRLQKNPEAIQESHFNMQKQTFPPKQQYFQAISKNQMPTIQRPNQKQDIQPQQFSHKHFANEPLQQQRFQFAGQPRLSQQSFQRPHLQSYGQLPLQQQIGHATVQNQLVRVPLQQPSAHGLTQQRFINILQKDSNSLTQNKVKQKTQPNSFQNKWLLPTEQNAYIPAQNQMNPQQGLQYSTPSGHQTVTKQQNSELSRQHQLLQLQHSVQANRPRNMVQVSRPRQPVITSSQQPTQALQTKQRFSVPKPSTQVSSSSMVNTSQLPQIQNLFDHLKFRESIQRRVRSGESETLNRTIVTNASQVQPVSRPPPYHADAHPPQYSWPNQHVKQQVQYIQRLTNPESIQPTSGNAITMEKRFGSKMCAVRECGQLATIACSLCRAVFYCSHDCQRNHWYNSHSSDACGTNNYGTDQ